MTGAALLLAALLAGAPAAGPARAGEPAGIDGRAAARAAVARAELDYKLGRFDRAVEGYTRAYELYRAPALLFNIGQCHKKLGNHERAIFFFEGYLREETRTDSAKRALAEDLIGESRAALAQDRAASAARARAAAETRAAQARAQRRPAREPLPGLRPQSQVAPAVVIDAAARPAAREAPAASSHRWWLWTTLAVVAAGAAGAAAYYYTTGEPHLVPPAGSVGTLDRR